jgi:hypothetical protein
MGLTCLNTFNYNLEYKKRGCFKSIKGFRPRRDDTLTTFETASLNV